MRAMVRCPNDILDKVIDKLKGLGFVQDARFGRIPETSLGTTLIYGDLPDSFLKTDGYPVDQDADVDRCTFFPDIQLEPCISQEQKGKISNYIVHIT